MTRWHAAVCAALLAGGAGIALAAGIVRAPPSATVSVPALSTASAPEPWSGDTIPVPETTTDCPVFDIMEPARVNTHELFFARAAYTSGFGGGWGMNRRGSWAIDFPKSDRQFLFVLSRLLNVHAFPCENPVRLDDPELHRFPYLYMVEPGRTMSLSDAEATGLRNYLLKGGFLHVDDFWGSQEWAHFERELRRVFPDRPIVEIPMDHPIFHVGFKVEEVLTVPSIGNARRGVYHERDGYIPYVLGVFDDRDRLMVVITWNSDLGDAWEWAEQPDYPRDRSDYAFKLGVNFILYAMTH